MSLAFVREIHGWPVESTHKGPEAWKMFPVDDVIMQFKDKKPTAYINLPNIGRLFREYSGTINIIHAFILHKLLDEFG